MPSKTETPLLPSGVDWLTNYGAGILARHIVAYWKARGYSNVLAERYEVEGIPDNFGVRSNLVAGFPPGKRRTAGRTAA